MGGYVDMISLLTILVDNDNGMVMASATTTKTLSST
jgi:hypothetical protein